MPRVIRPNQKQRLESMDKTAVLKIGDDTYDFPIIVGSEGERAVIVEKLRNQSGFITFDEGYGNTGSCKSAITFIDGEKGILRYRGYPVEQMAENSTFLESAYLVIYGELPTQPQLEDFEGRVSRNAGLHSDMEHHFEGFPADAHPMAIMSALLNSLGCFHPEMSSNNRKQDLEHFDDAATFIISKARTIAAMSYRKKMNLPVVESRQDLNYAENFLHMMFSESDHPYDPSENKEASRAVDLFFLLHADHEQNCSTSTVRMVASSHANLFASVSSGVCALWGPLHGGANTAVIKMLESIRESGDDGQLFIEGAKSGKHKLMGFGHRVYKNFDPRTKIITKALDKVLKTLGREDPLLDIARHLEKVALSDDYFIKRRLYPNVDFYSGILLRAIGIPLDMFPVMFAIGRMPGWIANWKELADGSHSHIHRPRQIYTGSTTRDYVPMDKRS